MVSLFVWHLRSGLYPMDALDAKNPCEIGYLLEPLVIAESSSIILSFSIIQTCTSRCLSRRSTVKTPLPCSISALLFDPLAIRFPGCTVT